MPIINAYTQLFFNEPLNVSIQKGDMVYYVSTTLAAPPQGPSPNTPFRVNSGNIQEIGEVFEVYNQSIVCIFSCDHPSLNGADCGAHIPGGEDFIMFSKDNAVNMSSVLGYYAEVEMVNDSNEKAKLFAVSTNVSESSK